MGEDRREKPLPLSIARFKPNTSLSLQKGTGRQEAIDQPSRLAVGDYHG